MTDEEILREMHGTIQRIDERTDMHSRQIGTIFSLMNGGGCSAGKSNQVAIRWIWTIGSLAVMAVFSVIAYFHV